MTISPEQGSFFNLVDRSETVVIQRDGLELSYMPGFISSALADRWFEQLKEEVEWRQHSLTVYGKQHLTPRLTCWMAGSGLNYGYSNHTLLPTKWAPSVLAIKQRIEDAVGEQFNSVLLNYYRDGQDSNGWHADDEAELGRQPLIASLSLGCGRDFDLRQKRDHKDKVRLHLVRGSLLIMRGKTQEFWQHQVPKRAHVGPRINLTFRKIVKKSLD